MANLKTVLWINVIVFAIVAIFHLLRVLLNWDLQIGNWLAPVWLSVIAVIITATMVYLNSKHLKK
jgi:branched-subunit amino acid permease